MKKVIVMLAVLALATSLVVAEEIKDPHPGVPTNPDLRLPCGPDDYGYVCSDPCLYEFIDISGSAQYAFDGDDVSMVVPLDMPFMLYGTTYNQLVMSSNGYISTDPTDSGGDLTNDCPLPDDPSTGGGGRIYVLHDDLDLEPGFGMGYAQYFEVCPRPGRAENEPCTIFMWDNVAHYPGGATAPNWDMEALFYHVTGDIAFQIGAGNPELGASSTTGLMDELYIWALNITCDTADSVPDNACWFILSPDAVGNEAMSFGALKDTYK